MDDVIIIIIMDDETIRVAVGLRLGASLCHPYQCQHCGGEVDSLGTHGLSCRWSEGRFSRHAALNEIIHRSLQSANVPSHLEPAGLYRSDGRRPDGISIIPWKCGKCLLWDATTPDTYAPSHRSVAVRGAGEVALQAEHLKHSKYSALEAKYHFVPVAVETSGVFGPEAHEFLHELGHRMARVSLEPKSLQFLIQQISVAVQRGNATAVLGTVARDSLL